MKFMVARILNIYRLPFRLTLVLSVLVATLVATYLLVTTTTPGEVGPMGVTALFVLIFVATITTLTLVKMLILRSTSVTIEGLVGLALVPTLLFALGSLRQLDLLDVVLIFIFSGLVNFYVRKATKKPEPN